MLLSPSTELDCSQLDGKDGYIASQKGMKYFIIPSEKPALW